MYVTWDLVESSETAWQAAERMHQRAVGCLLTLNDQQQPIGIITDRDLVERVMAAGLDPDQTTIADVMTRDVKPVTENTAIESALSLMRSGRFRRLPVVDQQGSLVGLVSLDDVLMLLAEEFADIGRLLERETPGGIAAESATD